MMLLGEFKLIICKYEYYTTFHSVINIEKYSLSHNIFGVHSYTFKLSNFMI